MLTNTLETIIHWLPQLGASLLIFIAFLICAYIAKWIFTNINNKLNAGRQYIFNLLGRIVKAAIIIVGVVTALGSMGVNVSALVASLGLTGFALSFALKDSLSNLLAGIMIIAYQPFKLGDDIVVGGFAGRVKAINLRYTTLFTEDKHILVPNANILTKEVTVTDAVSQTSLANQSGEVLQHD